MFLHLSVSHSVHGGVPAPVHAGIHPLSRPPRQTHPLGRRPNRADTPPIGRHPPGQTPLSQVATATDGTHPTGMHIWFKLVSLNILVSNI